MTAQSLAQQLKTRFSDILSEPAEFRGEVTLKLSTVDRIVEVCAHAKQEMGFDFLVDISSIDNYGDDPRFTLVYHLHGLAHRCCLRLKADVGEEQSEAPSIIGVWRSADWHEREIYDMMGIRFRGHPDLRRILMWDGYPYFPLRKDFPLAGKPPLAGGPFVTIAGGKDTISREPRVRIPETDSLETNARLERRDDVKRAHGESFGPGPMGPKQPG